MPKTRFTWTLLLIGSLLLGVAWILQSRETVEGKEDASAASVAEAPVAGYRAPDFTLTTAQGKTFTLGEYRGQPVVLNFWATWCPPCRAEIPHFQAASLKYNGQVAIIGVDDGEPLSTVAPFASELGMTYPLPLDEQSIVGRQYRVNSLPSTFFIDRDGIIRYVHIGILNGAVLEERISELLSG